jgi:hypothetical protein
MKLSLFARIWCFVYGSFGLGLFIIPYPFMSSYGIDLNDSGIMMSRILGSSLIGFAFVFWLNREVPLTNKAWQNLMIGSLVYNLLDLPVVLISVLNGLMNSMGWLPVGLHLFLAMSFGYFAFSKNK